MVAKIPNSVLKESVTDPDAYTKESVRQALSIASMNYSSLQSRKDELQEGLSLYTKAFAISKTSNSFLRSAVLSETQQVFSSVDKLKALALKDRPAKLLNSDSTFVYSLRTNEWEEIPSCEDSRYEQLTLF